MAIDVGTGDGRYVLARANAIPRALVIGLDASAAAMAKASRRAERARVGNVLFLAADLARVGPALAGVATEVTVHFPWGSLLDAALSADPALTGLVAPSGQLRILVSAGMRDAGRGVAELDPCSIDATYRERGLVALESRPATIADAVDACSSWGKRLLRNPAREREAWLMAYTRTSSARRSQERA